jgi:hypothetical protein
MHIIKINVLAPYWSHHALLEICLKTGNFTKQLKGLLEGSMERTKSRFDKGSPLIKACPCLKGRPSTPLRGTLEEEDVRVAVVLVS